MYLLLCTRILSCENYLQVNQPKLPKSKVMPIRKDADAVIILKVWFDIPVESIKESIPLDFEVYLIPPRVAEYIMLLESFHIDVLPKLPPKTV